MNYENAPDIWFPHLGIEIQTLNRVAFTIFGLEIFWYAIFIVLGIIAGAAVGIYSGKRSGQNVDIYFDALLWGVICAFIGLRLFYVTFNWDAYRDNPIRVITGIRDGGLAIYGGIIGAVVAALLVSRNHKMSVWKLLDTAIVGFPLGQAIGRWGNFFNREAHGGFTDNLFAMRMRVGVEGGGMRLTPDIVENMVYARGVYYAQVHPTFLYESLWSLLLLGVLLFLRPYKKYHGEVFLLFLGGYSLARVFIEGLRTDQLMLFSLPINQVLAGLLVLLCFGLLVANRIRKVENLT